MRKVQSTLVAIAILLAFGLGMATGGRYQVAGNATMLVKLDRWTGVTWSWSSPADAEISDAMDVSWRRMD